jgi:FkbM family methyltransferase
VDARALGRKLGSARRIYGEQGVSGLLRAVGRQVGYAPLDRSSVDEVAIVTAALEIDSRRGTMIDVGGHYGAASLPYCKAGWRVVAFEPDAENRARLLTAIGNFPNASIDPRALSDQAKDAMTFYRSPQSTGISGLSAFHASHVAADTVPVTTLDAALREHGVEAVDFLKVDTEGFDLFVLKGLPWERIRPKALVCEFEDAKTRPLGYDFPALGAYLSDKGYTVMVSEWEPIVRYGGKHRWSRFKRWPCDLASPAGWGNLIAAADPDLFARIESSCHRVAARLQ